MSIYNNIYNRYRKRLKAVLLSALLLTSCLASAQVVIKGNVYGGGLEGQVKNPKAASNVFGDASVTINGGTIESSVFGGGKGVETDEKSGLVEGNTTVTMTGGVVERSIYGGGSLGSVGTFSFDSLVVYTEGLHAGTNVHLPTLRGWVPQTGRATVSVTGGTVGLRGSLMPWTNHDPLEDDRGWIFCGSRGEADSITYPRVIAMGVVKDTHLEISGSALVTASAYGGCENGLVLDSTFVEIKGGQIGTGLKKIDTINDVLVGTFAEPYTDQNWSDAINAVKNGTIASALAEGGALYNKFYACDAWNYGDTNSPKQYNVYDIYYGEDGYTPLNSATEGSNGQTYFGNVFGGGSGYYPIAPGIWRRSAGRVNGNTRVEITGGHILTSVYGGNETTDVMGKATVIMTGGTIGIPRAVDSINKHPVLFNLFGAGKGDQRVWANKWTNVEETDVKFTGGVIFGSIFGGGEDGHVMGDTKLIVKEDENEILIGTFGYTGFEGHVYGSGRGFSGDALTAGSVCGNTNVTIKNGTILGSVYGGGRNGSVGPKLCDYDELGYGLIQLGDYGKTKVIIEGGTIGNDYEVANNPGGNVFGGSMGSLTILDGSPNPMWPRMSRVGSTEIQISQAADADTTLIKGSVYGGCGLGTVNYDTKVTIASGTIRGDVYGSGFGSDNTTMINNNVVGIYENGVLVDADTVPSIPLQRAGLVEGNTEIIMQGGRVLGNVYGGGMLASVGQIEAVHETPTDPNSTIVDYTPVANTGLAKITISGGQVGIPIPNPLPSSDYKPSVGYVYGGGKGIGDDVSNTYKAGVNVNSTFVTIDLPDANTADTTNNRIWCCVFGGGADGHVLDTTGVLIKSGVIGTYGKYRFEGNVFGGGRNDHGINYTAGRVGGNTHVTVEDGLVKSNVYGGGNSGSTGADLNGIAYATNLGEHGNTTVDIKGGKVGTLKYDYKHGHDSGDLDTIINVGDGGNVYGGGRGNKDKADLARVMRNTYVNISGGHVMNNVYGGGENGSVGRREAITNSDDDIIDYKPVENTGLATVTVTGGQVGPAPRVETGYNIPCGLSGENGYVFGGGMGVSNDYITNPELPYSGNYYAVADVNYTKVTIDMPMPTSGDNNANRIWGSIFGGAEDGHVLGSDTVHFVNGLLGTHGTSSYDGNIFGGGRNYSKANYNAGRVRSNITVEMTGGQILGSIFGGGRLALTGVGLFGDVMVDANGKKYGSTHVMVKGGTIGNDAEEDPTESGKTYMETFTKYAMGDVYGGGRGSMEGIVGHPKASALLVALVKNTKVEISETDATNHPTRILGSVFGGGEVGNVGQFTWNLDVTDPLCLTTDPNDSNYDPNHPDTITIGNIALVDGTGKTEVTVSGGRIGLDKMKMDVTLVGGSDEDRYDLKYHYDVGHVFGGGEGLSGRNPNSYPTINPSSTTAGIYNNKSLLDLMAVVGETQVTIEGTAFVKGSVYGGSMSGRVLGDAKVKIDGGQIGAGYYVINDIQKDSLYDPGKFFNPVTYFTENGTYTDVDEADTLKGCIRWDYVANDQKPFDPIEIYKGINVSGVYTYKPTNGETWFGHVFGGGSGYYPYIITLPAAGSLPARDTAIWNPDAGKVFGHTEVEITGGHILSNVYGGNQTTDVGNYVVVDAACHDTLPDLPVGQLYNHSDVSSSGKAIVTMSGGTVGVPRTKSSIQEFPFTSNVYGGGQGNFADSLKALNNVDSTRVTISDDAIVYGMVFGGSQNAHVLGNTKVLVKGGVIGITGLSGYDGCVFGGGQGTSCLNPGHYDTIYAHAGRVGGNTRVIMSGGKALGNLYGGGLVALTGVGVGGWFDAFTTGTTYDSEHHGKAKVELSGGYVGNYFNGGLNLLRNTYPSGNVYGGGRGKLDEYKQDDMARLANSAVVISGSPTIYGSVYGGGEMANVGYWRGYGHGWYATNTASTSVTITGTPTIGTLLEFKDQTGVAYSQAPSNWTYYDTIRFVKYATLPNTQNDTTYLRMLLHTRTGNVYGGGQGEVVIEEESGYSVYGLEQGHCATTNVNINMTNGEDVGHIMGSVFGGSEEGVVWGETEVHIAGGTIGTETIKPSRWTGEWTTVTDTTYSYGNVFGGSYGKDYYLSFSSLNITNPRPAMIDSVNNCPGRVYGNTLVDITGGAIRGNVYGGGDMASVGIWDSVKDGSNHFVDIKPIADSDRPTFRGNTRVNVSGSAVIGPLDGTGLNAYVFGGGKGFSSDPDELRKAYCNVDSTFVTVSGGTIWGSVFGGGNDAHVLGSTSVIVHSGANIGTNGLSTWDGNIFGGGRNFQNSNHSNGRVAGNIDITMDGGTLQGSIFGGGRMALTGVNMLGNPYVTGHDYDSVADGKTIHGLVTINVSGEYASQYSSTNGYSTSIGNPDGDKLLNGSDESVGDIFGSGKGDTKAYDDILAGRVANSKINITGSPRIFGSVFGGGEMAGIGYWYEDGGKAKFYDQSGTSEVTISGNPVIGTEYEFGSEYYNTQHKWTVYDTDGTLIHTCTGNVFGGSQGDVDITAPHWVSMARSRTSTVTINGGNIMSRVFGGAEQGTVATNTSVTINGGIIGTLVTKPNSSETYYMGGVYGGGFGSHKAELNVTHPNDSLNVRSDSLAGRVYGNILVDVLGGTIRGNVYGGASYAYIGGYGNSPNGNVQLNIGSPAQAQAGDPTKGTTILGSVFGANNHSGTPLGSVNVDVYHTAHRTWTDENNVQYTDFAPTLPTGLVWTPDLLFENVNGTGHFDKKQAYAIKEVFAGGNRASYTPNQAPGRTIPRNATVHVHYCENTIEDLYGGSNAADIGTSLTSANDSVVVDGGRFYRTFGGGKGTEAYADVHGTASTRINAGVIQEVYGGGNHNGIIDEIDLEITHANADVCDDFIYDVFGGNNEAEAFGDIVSVINCGDGYQYEFYGGNNVATIYGNVTTHVFGGETVYLFGGSKGSSTTAAHIRQFPSYDSITADTLYHHNHPEVPRKYSDALLEYMGYPNNFNTSLVGKGGNVTLNLFGGRITEAAFGGSDVNGTIDGKITVNVFDAETNCGLDLKNLYGGGRTTSYDPIYGSSGTERITPEVNVIHGIVKGNVFGGGMGATATTTASPLVNIGYDVNVFGDPTVQNSFMDILYDTIHKYCDTIKPAPATSYSWPEPAVSHYADTVKHEVYGGGELAGVTGNTRVNMFRGAVGIHGTSGTDGNIFGGGQGTEGSLTAGRVGGNTVVEMRDGTVMGNIYGGGRLGLTGVDVDGTMQSGEDHGHTKVMVKGGTVGNADEIVEFSDFSMGNIYGGGKGFLDYGKNNDGTTNYSLVEDVLLLGLTKNTTIEVSDTLGNNTHVYGIILGGGEIANVGKYTLTKDGSGNITNIAVTEGATNVRVGGGIIGGDRSQMRYQLAKPNDPTDWYSKYNDDLGYVYGGGEGWSDNPEDYAWVQESNDPVTNTRLVDLLATVQSTEVTITNDTIKTGANAGEPSKPWVKASVFGGSESGHVRGNTKVIISGGLIGAGDNGTADVRYDDDDFFNPVTTEVTATNSLKGTANWHYEAPYNPYDPAKIRNQYNAGTGEYGYKPCDGKSWFGNVFGGGSGWFPYVTGTTAGNFESHWNPLSGKVWGNTEVIITGGHILNNVYGANEMTDVGGKATIKMSGGTVGVPRTREQVLAQPVTCYVFGGGCGDPRDIFYDKTNVDSTNVQITGGIVYGSVFGGAEDGHILGDAKVTIGEGDEFTVGEAPNAITYTYPVIGSMGTSSADGNIFGGGRNFLAENYTAGRVGGNIDITMKGGVLLGSIFGGGRLGITGIDINGNMITTDPDDHGNVTINISGGTVGNESKILEWLAAQNHTSMGDVFGGGKGIQSVTTPDIDAYNLARVKNSEVNISGAAKVLGSVFGGGELASVGWYNYQADGQGHKHYLAEPNTGLAKVNISGGQVGVEQAGQAEVLGANVFGGGLGIVGGKAALPFANVDSTKVNISGTAYIVASVFGGGDKGHVTRSTNINVSGGTVGKKNTLYELYTDRYEQAHTHMYTGSVLAGGRGIDAMPDGTYNDTTGLVFGNANVTVDGTAVVRHAVYGGGGLSSVGTYIKDSEGAYTIIKGGKTYVNVGGTALVGPTKKDLTEVTSEELAATASLYGSALTSATQYADSAFKYLGGNAGWVFGAGCGLAGNAFSKLTYNDSTFVRVYGDAQVVGSVYGGGENGHVHCSTDVTVSGGTIGGVPLHGDSTGMANGTSLEYPILSGHYSGVTVHLAKNDGELNEDEYGYGRHIFRGAVYGGGKGTDTVADPSSNYVFSPTAGRVFGNTKVTVSDSAVIYNRVYGGGLIASIGNFEYYKNDLPAGISLTDSIQRIHYINDKGVATINIKGGTIGTDGLNNGDVVGGGRGMVGRPIDTINVTVDESDQVVHLAYVRSTNVNISEEKPNYPTRIKSNVYGGSINGSVHGDAHVTVTGGTIGTMRTDDPNKVHGGWHSNVFGGGGGSGRYKLANGQKHLSIAAGRVFGNTHVEITGGTVKHNVYGGGAIASVGTYDLRANAPSPYIENTGEATVTITGASTVIGYDGNENGMVFGSGRGEIDSVGAYMDSLSYTIKTRVTIGTLHASDGPKVKGSVYGSGENGHVYDSAIVNVHSGIIGCDADEYTANASNSAWLERFPYRGNVYGSGCGTDTYPVTIKIPNTTRDTIVGRYNPTSGVVTGNTKVTITGGTISHNVYGGGAMANVGLSHLGINQEGSGHTNIIISGGQIGLDDAVQNQGQKVGGGTVYGGGRGKILDTLWLNPEWDFLANVNSTDVTVKGTTLIKSSVFGGGEDGRVLGNTSVKIQESAKIGVQDQSMAFHRGNVYGGGSGNDSIVFYHPNSNSAVVDSVKLNQNAGQVGGNTRVEMAGGTVYGNIYGGCELTDVLGHATVIMTGGQVGWERDSASIAQKPRYGYVYGSGKGDPSTRYNTWTNVDSTYVKVNMPLYDGTTHKDRIWGSVFGGGEEAHVLRHTHVVVEDGMIGTLGTTGAEGNVFGSGRGKNPVALTAGSIGGNTRIDISGGEMLGSVFGGGDNGSVGIYLVPSTDGLYGVMQEGPSHGYTIVNITGGTIGHVDSYNGSIGGNVYGGGRGKAGAPNTVYQRLAKVKQTEVNISEATGKETYIRGSVFGSGEDGHVLVDTYVNIFNGQIGGTAYTTDINNVVACSDMYHGNVYGGGRGLDTYTSGGSQLHSITAGKVERNTYVNIYGGRIVRNVYGGGNLSSVGDPAYDSTGWATVNIYGGYIGTLQNEDDYHGNVFGGGHGGIGGEYINLAYVKNTQVTIDSVARVFGSVFGGGEDGHVRKNTLVDVKGGIIGKNADTDVLHGNVYGGGRGIIISSNNVTNTAGEVFGHSTVNIEKSGRKDVNGNFYTPTVYHNVYGGGSRSVVGEYKVLNISDGTIKGNAFGGSRDIPKVRTNTSPRWVNMWGGTIEGNLYGCSHNSIDNNPTNPHSDNGWASFINLSGGTINGNVFGGGFGGQIEGIAHDTVYGGVVKGSVGILIGKNAIESRALTEIGSADSLVHLENSIIPQGKLDIKGSVYAGSNQVLDSTWGKHAITGYSNIYIDGYGYNTTDGSTAANYMNISGGLFGSGSNCEAGEERHNILVREFGTRNSGTDYTASRTLTTIQRCDTLLFDHVNIKLSGAYDISNADASANPRKKYGVLKVDDVLMATNATGLVLGANQQAVYIDSVPQVRSLYWNGGESSSVYQHAAVHNNSNWEWIGIQNNDNKLYRIPSSGTPVQLTAEQENVIRFNDMSKMWVRTHDRMANSAGVLSDTSVYGELQGFFRLRADSYDPHGNESFAYARPKFTSPDKTEPDENTSDGGFLSYLESHNFFTDGGANYTKTKQYPYINEIVPFPDSPIRGNRSDFRRKWVYPQNGHIWYVDGTLGWGRDTLRSVDPHSGHYPDKPKKTITGRTAGGVGSGVISDTHTPGKFSYFNDHIYVVGALSALDEVGPLCDSIDNDGNHYPLRLYRYPGGHAMSNGYDDYGGGQAPNSPGNWGMPTTGTDAELHAGPGANYGALLNVQGGESSGASITLQGVMMDGLNGYAQNEVEFHKIPTASPFTVYDSTLVSKPLVLTHKNSTLNLEGGTVLMRGYNNTDAAVWYTNADYAAPSGGSSLTAYHGGAVFVDSLATVNVKGLVTITGNKQKKGTGLVESNVYLPTFNKSLSITNVLDANSEIGITSPKRNKAASYVNNTFSPVAVGVRSGLTNTVPNAALDAQAAWENCNFLDDQNWFFVNGHSTSTTSTQRTTYYKPSISGKPDDNTNGNTVYFGWTWANVVRQQPPTTGYEVSDDNIDVKTKEGMAWLISQSAGMNGQTATSFSSKTIRQTADFSMGQYVWVPIGDGATSFAGTYDGQGHLIDSVYIEYIGIGDKIYERNDYGLFGRVSNGTVKRTFVVDGKIRPAAKPQSSSKAGPDESYLPEVPEGDTLIDNVADMEGRGIIDAIVPYNIGGLVGYLEGNAEISNSEAAITVPFFSNDSLVVGGLVGLMANGTVHSSMAMPFVNDIHEGSGGNYWKGLVGGLIGSAEGGKIHNSFASSQFGVSDAPKRIKIGGLLGKNTNSKMSNCYMALRQVNSETLPASVFGSIAASNTTASNIDSCYMLENTIYDTVISGSANSTCHQYKPVISANELGYMCADNKVIGAPKSDTTLFQLLNNWVDKHSGHTYARWARPGLSEINGDLPVLLLDEFGSSRAENHEGDFRTVATYEHSHVLQYGGPVRDGTSNQLDGAIGRMATKDALFVYGDITVAPAASPESKTKISVFEDAAILQAGTLGSYDSTYVGITFDNSSRKANSTPGINTGLQITNGVVLGGSYLLPRDWHMLSTPLSDAPLGFDYMLYDANGDTVKDANGNPVNTNITGYSGNNNYVEGDYYNNPWDQVYNSWPVSHEFKWLLHRGSDECTDYTSENRTDYRYWMKPYEIADGYFPTRRGDLFSDPTNIELPLPSQIKNLFIVNDGQTPSDEYYTYEGTGHNRYPYGMDFYTWTEPDYHWINFKRNGPNHWHSDDPHKHLDYLTEEASDHTVTENQNEDVMISGKGYMTAIAIPTMLQSHGTLNHDEQYIKVTKSENSLMPGWNLVGNPYHAYLDFDKFVDYGDNSVILETSEYLGNKPFYVVYNADSCKKEGAYTAFLYYPYGCSKNGEYADRFIHPHQGFYVSAKKTDRLKFVDGPDLLVTRKDAGDSHFRDERPSYPLVNLYLSSDKGCADVTVVELERPEWGGATKLKELRVGNGLFYGHYDGESYAAIFAQKGAERVPIRFEAKEDDIFTIKWNTANADFHSLYLIDNITGVQYDMLRNDTYVFEGHKSDYKSRFYITFDVTGVDEYEHTSFVFFDGSQLVVTGEGDFEMVDVLGRVLMHTHVDGGQTRLSLPRVAPSVYFMRLTNGSGTHVQKIIIEKNS